MAPYGTNRNLGAAPFSALPFDTIPSAAVMEVLGERQEYSWSRMFIPDRVAPVGSFSASFFEWEDIVNLPGEYDDPTSRRWRSINQFPAVDTSDGEFANQASVELFDGTGSGTSGACSIQTKQNAPLSASFTFVMPFLYTRPPSNLTHRTLFSVNKTGTGAWLYVYRPNGTYDQLRFTPDQQTLGASTASYQFTPAELVEDTAHIAILSFDDADKKSEIWLDGELVSQYTHSAGVITTGAQFVNLGNLTSGTSPIAKLGVVGISDYPMARRDGGGNLVQPDLIPRLFEGLMPLYGVA